MRVIPIASTVINPHKLEAASNAQYEAAGFTGTDVTYSDELAEFAGRNCYQSWARPNPQTADNRSYLRNILAQQHESVLEHASVTFYIDGVSRSLLAELCRHRHLSFSVLSQRYVRHDSSQYVAPPAIEEYDRRVVETWEDEDYPLTVGELFTDALDYADGAYNSLANTLIIAGVRRKKAYEAARSVLPNAAETKMVVTGNIRAWRDVLKKRHHIAADAEIAQLAALVLIELKNIAPNSVQDIPDTAYGDTSASVHGV